MGQKWSFNQTNGIPKTSILNWAVPVKVGYVVTLPDHHPSYNSLSTLDIITLCVVSLVIPLVVLYCLICYKPLPCSLLSPYWAVPDQCTENARLLQVNTAHGNSLSQLHIVFILCRCAFPGELIMSHINHLDLLISFMQRWLLSVQHVHISAELQEQRVPTNSFLLSHTESRITKIGAEMLPTANLQPSCLWWICISASQGESQGKQHLPQKMLLFDPVRECLQSQSLSQNNGDNPPI